nr:toxin ChpB [Azotobacter vinelandii]WKN24544.1 toxin ChpB [Azotobacter vinelandii]
MLCNQIRTVDLDARGAKRIESVSNVVIDDALARVQALFE